MEEGMSSMQQKAAELEHMAEVLLTGEQLRLRLHEEKVIKDRRHHLKTYPNCFVAKELIDWLIDHKEASDRETAIKLVQKLLDHSIIHHVCDEHKEFKDVKLFYRFRKDDGTFPLDNEVKVFMRGQRLYEKLMSSDNTLLQAREEEGVKYERTFVASEFIDWLIQEGEATTRTEAEQLGRRLLEHGIIQHGAEHSLMPEKQLSLLVMLRSCSSMFGPERGYRLRLKYYYICPGGVTSLRQELNISSWSSTMCLADAPSPRSSLC